MHPKHVSTEPLRNYFSLESTEQFINVKIALGLEADFRQLDIYSNHICQNCKDLLRTFILVRETALPNENFIIQCQDNISQIGFYEAKRKFESCFEEVQSEVLNGDDDNNKYEKCYEIQEGFGGDDVFTIKEEMSEKESRDITIEIQYEGDIFERSVQLNVETDKPIDEQECIKAIERKDPDQASTNAHYFGNDDSESECGNDDTSEKKKTRKRAKPSTRVIKL